MIAASLDTTMLDHRYSHYLSFGGMQSPSSTNYVGPKEEEKTGVKDNLIQTTTAPVLEANEQSQSTIAQNPNLGSVVSQSTVVGSRGR